MKILNVVTDLLSVGPRFAQGEEKAAALIQQMLTDNKVSFIDQQYEASVPLASTVSLTVDGKAIDARNVGMESGTFTNKDALVSSLYWGDTDFYLPPNINFNPRCKTTISMALYYKHAAIAVRRDDVPLILAAEKVTGQTVVEPYNFTGHNYLVGNTTNPKSVIFTHYDCWESGAIDNASGTAVLINTVIKHPELLKDHLFAICGTEEISYEEPIYWGKGYRAFQEKYNHLLEEAKEILVVDCVGYSSHVWATDPEHVVLGLPLNKFESYAQKSAMLCGDFDTLMSVYHSNDDTVDLLSEELLDDAQKLLLEKLQSL
ncbi:MAG: hypothetical protein ACEQSA_02825 [Weeksellaceae bacterium]